MLTMNYTYRIYPDAVQQTKLLEWLETCRGVYNHALRELKDWIASRKCQVDRCSLEKEYIIPANEPFPSYHRQQNNLPKAKKQFPHLSKVFVAQGLWGTETACQVGLSGVYDLDKWRGAGISKSDLGKPALYPLG